MAEAVPIPEFLKDRLTVYEVVKEYTPADTFHYSREALRCRVILDGEQRVLVAYSWDGAWWQSWDFWCPASADLLLEWPLVLAKNKEDEACALASFAVVRHMPRQSLIHRRHE